MFCVLCGPWRLCAKNSVFQRKKLFSSQVEIRLMLSLRKKGEPLKPYLWLIRTIGVIVPRSLRADWKQEWKAELQYREALLAEWDKLNRRTKLNLLWRSVGAFWDALW